MRIPDWLNRMTHLRNTVPFLSFAIISGVIAKGTENLTSPETLAELTRFQCARLDDISHFNPTQLLSLSLASLSDPGSLNWANETKTVTHYTIIDRSCTASAVQNSGGQNQEAFCAKTADDEIAAQDAASAPQPGTSGATPGGPMRATEELAEIDRRIVELRPAILNNNIAELKVLKQLNDRYRDLDRRQSAAILNCMSATQDGLGHWANALIDPHKAQNPMMIFAIPGIAVADMIFHKLFQVSWASLVNWTCLFAGIYAIRLAANKFGLQSFRLLAFAYPIGAVVLGSIAALFLQYAIIGSLHLFGHTIQLIGLTIGATATFSLVGVLGASIYSSLEHLAAASVEKKVKSALEPRIKAPASTTEASTDDFTD